MTKKKNIGLGKGLGALLPSVEMKNKGAEPVPESSDERTGILMDIELSKIHTNPYQPRHDFDPDALEDLKNSIIEHGLIQPITVRRDFNGYELIAGERRMRASIKAGLEKVPAYIIDVDSGVEMLELAIIENVQRENLNPVEIANGYQRLIEECGLTQEQVSQKVSKNRSTVTNFLRLLKLPTKVQDSVRFKEISMGHARALLGLANDEKIHAVWEEIKEHGLSVRATEKLVKEIENSDSNKKDEKPKNNKPSISDEVNMILEDNENKLRHVFGTQVKIKAKTEESGSIEMEFYSKDDLERLLDMFYSIDDNK